ncbi:unnamed protein product [Acanthoscelides obtectus]|nr:unnamed protein product [Acanthoscelides obtectus]CAK1644739.1 hypothetical protein AOBTE_LOCUS13931 [Acanthoscelides obtectus]
MKNYGDRIAQYIEDTDEEDTYENLLTRCIRVAIWLKSKELTNEDVVTLCSKNHKDSCVPFIACLFLGIPVASLDPMLSAMDTTHLLKEVRPKILFVESKSVRLIDDCLTEAGIDAEVVVYGEIEDHACFQELLTPQEDEGEFQPEVVASLEETAIVLFSSGTTGLPKGIMISHYALLMQCQNMKQSENFGNVMLSYATLYWISTVIILTTMTYIGGARVICSKFNPKQTWLLIEKYQITSMFIPPSQMAELIACGRPENLDTSKLHCCISGGASVSEKQMREIRDLLPGTFVFQMYGQSEIAGIITIFNSNDVKDVLLLDKKPKSVGKVVAGICCKVVNPDTEELCGPNKNGELRLKSKMSMNGYYGRDSSESYDSDGWLRTGDEVYYDEDKCFYVVDRIKEMLKYRSWHVAPAMIEQVLCIIALVMVELTELYFSRCAYEMVILGTGGYLLICSVMLLTILADELSPYAEISFLLFGSIFNLLGGILMFIRSGFYKKNFRWTYVGPVNGTATEKYEVFAATAVTGLSSVMIVDLLVELFALILS